MKIGILKCDRVSDVFVERHGQYPEMFANLLRPVDPNIEFIVFDAENEVLPSDIHAVDAYLITGSRHGVNDGYPWIAQLEEFIRTVHAAQKKVIGICFGHQLIAKALGGKVIKSPKGWGVGMSQNQIVQQKDWMNPFKNEFNILVSHQDQVVALPQGAQVLAGSDFCPNYLMQIGTHFFSIQGHPEFTKDYSRDLMISREDAVDQHQFAQGIKSLELHEDDALIAQWIINFIRAV
ncbi:glutamine amidotransferase-related protein [Legionella bononiensis]|uniref:GMP synthase n=1 Tax=Legionella bononiensis TaxID=2793102 RepID=A0ABS1WAD2_9GAMM|nr:GMP synthase [Legionella bononiensis]MBL7480457.1 GMP synthase [Legionella bononiensis]MBL7526308.1 GMP synthase [Legionella bononiensis]MBL7563197.1 GMP synthase [Legionella bononiensis]